MSRDSQSGVPKLSWFGLPGLWTVIISCLDLRTRRGLNQCCSSRWELSNAISHSPNARWERVDSRLLVVGSQTASLTPRPSFAHNLGYRYPNDSCEAILDIYTSRPFQRYKEHPNARCFDLWNRLLSFRESRGTPNSHFRECEWRPHTSLKVGLRPFFKRGVKDSSFKTCLSSPPKANCSFTYHDLLKVCQMALHIHFFAATCFFILTNHK